MRNLPLELGRRDSGTVWRRGDGKEWANAAQTVEMAVVCGADEMARNGPMELGLWR